MRSNGRGFRHTQVAARPASCATAVHSWPFHNQAGTSRGFSVPAKVPAEELVRIDAYRRVGGQRRGANSYAFVGVSRTDDGFHLLGGRNQDLIADGRDHNDPA
jgi:hypothetical protein